MEAMCYSETSGGLKYTALNPRISYYGIVHWHENHEKRNFVQVPDKQSGVLNWEQGSQDQTPGPFLMLMGLTNRLLQANT
jgi:hypothetical protein